MTYHETTNNRKTRRMASQAAFTRGMRNFWSDHGLPALDRAVIVLVPTLIFAPTWVGWLA